MSTTRKEHFGRSAELQRLLDEAGSSSPPAGRRPRPSATPAPDPAVGAVPSRSQRPSAGVPGIPRPRTSTDAGTAPAGPAAPRVAQASSRPTGVGSPASPSTRPAPDPVTRPNLRSSPAVTFPRRVRPAAGRSTPETSTDPTAKLRRTALVRSPIERAGMRPAGSDRTARMVPTSRKAAVARRVAGRWGAAGYLPEQRAVGGPLAAARTPLLLPAATAPPAPPRPPAGPVARATGDQRPTPARPPTRPTQRRTLVLAGGVAAAVVAIVAIVSIGNRSGSGPATDAGQNPPTKVAMVQVTGADGQATVTTVTAPVGTVNGQLVALVTGDDGQVRQLAVVTAPPAAPARTSASPVRTSAPAAGGASTPTAPADPSAPGDTAAATGPPAPAAEVTGTQPPTTVATPSAPRSTSAVPGAPGDVATVVTGLTTLTGWEPVTTN